MSTNPFKLFVYIIVFILMVIVPPFGIISGFLFIIVHYMSRNDDKQEQQTRTEQPKSPNTLEEYYVQEKEKEKSAKEMSERNRKRNLTIKSDIGGR